MIKFRLRGIKNKEVTSGSLLADTST